MRLPSDPSPGDWFAGAVVLGSAAAIFVLWAMHGKWVAIGAGLMFFAFWAFLRVETGKWIDDFDEVEFTLKDPPTE